MAEVHQEIELQNQEVPRRAAGIDEGSRLSQRCGRALRLSEDLEDGRLLEKDLRPQLSSPIKGQSFVDPHQSLAESPLFPAERRFEPPHPGRAQTAGIAG